MERTEHTQTQKTQTHTHTQQLEKYSLYGNLRCNDTQALNKTALQSQNKGLLLQRMARANGCQVEENKPLSLTELNHLTKVILSKVRLMNVIGCVCGLKITEGR